MKKFISLLMALVMALSLTTVAWGAANEAEFGGTEYATVEAAVAAANTAGSGTVTMLTDAAIEASLVVNGITLDGNGYTLDATALNDMDDAVRSDDNSAIKTNGCTITNLTIVGGWKGILILQTATQDTLLDNVTIVESCRGLCFTKSGDVWSDADLTVVNSTIAGWNSFATNGDVVFENCEFVVNESGRGNGLNPRNDMTLANCVFAAGVEMNFEDLDADDSLTFVDCVYDGEPLTEDNFADFADDTYYDADVHAVAVAASVGAPVNFYVADGSADGWYLIDIFPGADLDDFEADDDNFLPCYEVPGYGFYVETSAAAGSYKLVYGAKTVYLKDVDWDDVYFDAKATVFTNVTDEDDVCGKLYVADLDDEDVFYSVYVKADKTTYYFVADKTGPYQLLVNGKLVKADLTTVQDLTAHAWAGYDVVNHAYTTVKCANCGKVAPLFANATAAGKDAVKVEVNGETLGWIAKAANGFGAASVGGTSTDKVESAQTFDAGIAMYVGMSVLAATGSAVVLKKREG